MPGQEVEFLRKLLVKGRVHLTVQQRGVGSGRKVPDKLAEAEWPSNRLCGWVGGIVITFGYAQGANKAMLVSPLSSPHLLPHSPTCVCPSLLLAHAGNLPPSVIPCFTLAS